MLTRNNPSPKSSKTYVRKNGYEVKSHIHAWLTWSPTTTIPAGLKFFAWYLLGVSGCLGPILYSTVNTIVKDDSEERALIMVPLLAFPTAGYDGAPRWRKGYPMTFVFYFFLWAGLITAVVLYRRRQGRGEVAAEIGSTSEDSELESVTFEERQQQVRAKA